MVTSSVLILIALVTATPLAIDLALFLYRLKRNRQTNAAIRRHRI